MKYRAPVEIIDLEDFSLEITYGHCNKIDCQLGQCTPHEYLATVGNTGEVYSGNHMVTEAEKEAGSTAGRHLHFQLRKCRKVLKSEFDDKFLMDSDGSLYMDNSYYYVWKENGYAGCIDPMPFFDTSVQNSIDDVNNRLVIESKGSSNDFVDFLKNYAQSLIKKILNR
jgi:hypothetical protein